MITHTDAEWARVQSLAIAHGVSVPRLYERALHAGDVIAAAKLTSLVSELGVVTRLMGNAASNINQVARVANSTGDVNAEQLFAAARHFDRQVERVVAIVAQVSQDGLYEEPDYDPETDGDDDTDYSIEGM